MNRWLITLGLVCALGAAVKADEGVILLPYWPNDGIWIYYDAGVGWDVGIWVYCGYGCAEFIGGYNIPPTGTDPSAQWVHDIATHNQYWDHPFWYAEIEHGDGDGYYETRYWGNAVPVWDCGDDRSPLNQEYVDVYSGGSVYFSLGMLPHCTWLDGDFNSSGGSTHFSWPDLNGGFMTGNPNYPWGIVRGSLYLGLEQTFTYYNRGAIRLSSGYRTPSGNANIPGSAFGSYHVRGRAADMYSRDQAWTEAEFNLLRQAAADTGTTVELFNWNTYTDHHLHAAW